MYLDRGAERSLANRVQGEEAAAVIDSAFQIAQDNSDTLSEYIDN